MLRIILYRLLQGAVVILIVSALTFALLGAAGGDALSSLSSDPLVSEATLRGLRHTYGLDEPLPVRYWRWLAGVLRGEMGYSLYYHTPAWSIIGPRLLNTLALATLALLISMTISLALGWLAARRAGGWADRLAGAVILLASSSPRIVLALIALALVARSPSFLMSGGAAAVGASPGISLMRIFIPATILSVPLVALFLAQARDGLLLSMREDFVQVARAKGLSERAVILRHALRAALNPLITIFGLSLGSLISGSVMVETVLGWPGLGQLSVVAAQARDVPLLMGVVLITATAVLVGNLVADILLCLNDPRLRQGAGKAVASGGAAAAAGAATPLS
ncbi:MAG TPA: ABC transporter permease [Pyrinomonadaceae bacterium]|jgi:peptide/nickel transport system permease protein